MAFTGWSSLFHIYIYGHIFFLKWPFEIWEVYRIPFLDRPIERVLWELFSILIKSLFNQIFCQEISDWNSHRSGGKSLFCCWLNNVKHRLSATVNHHVHRQLHVQTLNQGISLFTARIEDQVESVSPRAMWESSHWHDSLCFVSQWVGKMKDFWCQIYRLFGWAHDMEVS